MQQTKMSAGVARHGKFAAPRAFSSGCARPSGLGRALPVRAPFSQQFIARATAEDQAEVKEVVLGKAAAAAVPEGDSWVPICRPEDLPKGVRKEVEVDGRNVLVFWYRNGLYAVEARSPAEGAYSEGFITAKFTQDYCIECPSTGSLFSLKDGSIVSWYPNNAVLRALTPQSTCRPMEVYPVKLTQDAVYVDVSRGTLGGVKAASGRGGAGSSLENNNVFTVQPTVYFEGMDPTKEAATVYGSGQAQFNPAVLATGIVAVGIVAVAGTAVAIYSENLVLLGGFWAVLGGGAAYFAYQYINNSAKGPAK